MEHTHEEGKYSNYCGGLENNVYKTMFYVQCKTCWFFCDCFQFLLVSKSQMKFSGKSFTLSLKVWSNISFCATANVFFQSPTVPLRMNWGLRRWSPGTNSVWPWVLFHIFKSGFFHNMCNSSIIQAFLQELVDFLHCCPEILNVAPNTSV